MENCLVTLLIPALQKFVYKEFNCLLIYIYTAIVAINYNGIIYARISTLRFVVSKDCMSIGRLKSFQIAQISLKYQALNLTFVGKSLRSQALQCIVRLEDNLWTKKGLESFI